MVSKRIIPVVLLDSGAACKTIRFGERIYLGDPVNIAKIFSDIGVDEIIYLDITRGRHRAGPDMNLIRRIARQCAMPLTYGGGISTVDQARDVLSLGVEKVSIQRGFFENPDLIGQLADVFGQQSVLLSLDFCRRDEGDLLYVRDPVRGSLVPFDTMSDAVVSANAGEVIICAVDREGTFEGPDLELLARMRGLFEQPLIYVGGVKDMASIAAAHDLGADAVAGSASMVFKGAPTAVLLSYPKTGWNTISA